jgi:signal transduction histidine kinase
MTVWRAQIHMGVQLLALLLADLRAPVTAHDDLPAALGRLAQEVQARTGIAVMSCIRPDLPMLPADAREAFWYVAREALANVERHAAAASATLTLDHQRGSWLLRVEDDGSVITPAALRRPAHYGVVGMRERLEGIGGTFSIGRGATVEARVLAQVAQEASVQ